MTVYCFTVCLFFGLMPDPFPKIITHPLDEIFRLIKAGRLGDFWVGVFSSTGLQPGVTHVESLRDFSRIPM